MIKFLRLHKKEIFISLGTGLILYYFEPILSFLGNKIVTLSIYISKTFSNSFYEQLAEKDLNEVNEWGSMLVTYIFLFIIMSLILYAFYMKKDINQDIGELDTMIEQESENDDRNNKIEELKGRVTKIKKQRTRFNKIALVLNINSIILICFVIFMYSQIKVRKDMIIKFNNRIEALKPYLDSKEVDLFNSRWVLMKSSKDFDQLNIDLKSKLKALNIDK